MPIYFYSSSGLYSCFSNFSPHGFHLNSTSNPPNIIAYRTRPVDSNHWWPTVEHYYQAQKFAETNTHLLTAHEEEVRVCATPRDAKRLGRRYPIRSDWENVKNDVMYAAVLKKFQTHEDIRDILLSTGEELLVEDSPYDYYWGCGRDRSGKNMMGVTLMRVRSHLQKGEDGGS